MNMDHGADSMGGSCKISMLWNWDTIDACFLASSWRIANNGMFAATCVGVAAMAVLLEGLRRLARDFDSANQRRWTAQAAYQKQLLATTLDWEEQQQGGGESRTNKMTLTFRVSPLQQLIRAVLHAMTFSLAYIIMLLFMYFNGYVIISIILGAGIGKFLFDWPSTTIEVDVTPITPLSQKPLAVPEPEQRSCCQGRK